MAVTIALLQGVNVGKYKRISMADFKSIVTELGGEDATTIANSGNVAFRHEDSGDPEALRSAIEKAVSDRVGMPIPTITRSGDEILRVVADSPYPDVTDPKCLHVEFLLQTIPNVLDGIDFGNDHLTVLGRDIYMHLPNKTSGSTYNRQILLKRLGTHTTSRNWNTVVKLADLAAKLG